MKRPTLLEAAWCFAACIGVAATVSCRAQLDLEGLEGAWLFDEATGADLSDWSGNSCNGVFAGDPDRTDGKFGGALGFDGADDWVEITGWSTPELEDFTLGCWVKPADAQKRWANIMDTHQEPPTRGVTFEMNGVITNNYYLTWGSEKGWKGTRFVVQLDANRWQHLVGVRDGDQQTLYLDGVRGAGPGQVGVDPVVAGTSNFRIANWVNGDRNFRGEIDEPFLFSRALTDEEVELIGETGLRKYLDVPPSGKLTTMWAHVKAAP